MKSRRPFLYFVSALAGLSLLITGCATTKLRDTWQAESFSRSSFNNVLIIGLTSNKSNRFLFENGFSEVFSGKNITNTMSYTAMGEKYPTAEAVKAFVKDKSFDYVLVTKVGGMNIEKDYVAPRAVTYYSGPYYPRYYDNWAGNSVTLTREGYTDTKTDLLLVTSIYNAKTEELVWVGRSSTWDAQSTTVLAEDLARKVAAEITR